MFLQPDMTMLPDPVSTRRSLLRARRLRRESQVAAEPEAHLSSELCGVGAVSRPRPRLRASEAPAQAGSAEAHQPGAVQCVLCRAEPGVFSESSFCVER